MYGFHLGGFVQEKINLPARLLVLVPPGVGAIRNACGSGIGSAAIQLAKKMCCAVITTVGSNDKIEKAKMLGANQVINYREDHLEGVVRRLTKKQLRRAVKHVGKDTWAGSMFSLKRGSRPMTCGSTSGVSTEMNLMMLFRNSSSCLDPSASAWKTWLTPCIR